MILQFFLVILSSIYSQAWIEIDLSLYGLENLNYTKTHPFCHDYMFLVWNSIPFLLIGLLYRARINVQPLMQRIYSLDAFKHGTHWTNISSRNDKWAVFINHWALKFVIVFIALFFCYYQHFIKTENLVENREIYWWAWDISKYSYLVRMAALFFDVIGIILLFIVVIAMVDLISYILRGTRLRIDLHHSDGVAGLSFVGRLISLYVPFVIVMSANTVVAIVDHRRLGQVYFDWFFLSLIICLTFFLTIWPMIPVKRQIEAFLHKQIDRFSRQRQIVEDRIDILVDSPIEMDEKKANTFFTLTKLSTNLSGFEKSLNKSFCWPIKKSQAAALIFLGIAPIVLSLILMYVLD